jgi:ABC-type branched-subunit amino acid transport system substrate-binding protein
MRGRGLMLALALAASAACTAAPKQETAVDTLDAPTTTTVLGDGDGVAVPATVTIPGQAPAPTVPGAPAPTVTAATTPGGAPAPSAAPGPGGFVSTLYQGADDTAGITEDTITICAHAALTYAAAFNTSPEDLNVYWTAINEAGGIHGRRVEVFYENDDYKPDIAVQAATRCKQDHNPFILLGGIGFDQIPAVRTWAENNKTLYIHHTATSHGADNLQHSWTFLPTTETTGAMFGKLAVARLRDAHFGIIKRGSENWEPGIRGFKAVAEPAGIDIRLEREVPQNKGSYVQDIVDMRNAGVDTVFLWLNALESTQFITQADAQNWHPQFLVFPFNLTSQTLGEAAMNPPLLGVSMHNAYTFGEHGGPFAPYADDMQLFEQQYAEYRPGADIEGLAGDLLFLNWTGQKGLHQLLLQCGPDCTRNRLVEALHGFKGVPTSSACPVDMTRPGAGNSHRGGWALSIMETYEGPGGRISWRNTNTCVEGL